MVAVNPRISLWSLFAKMTFGWGLISKFEISSKVDRKNDIPSLYFGSFIP